MDANPEERLRSHGLQLPPLVRPRGSFRLYVMSGSMLYLSGKGAPLNLNQVTLPTADLERAVGFYRALGLVQIVSSPPRYARFECPDGGATLSLHHVAALPAGAGVVVYLECEDLDARYQGLRHKGIEFESPPTDQPWLWREAHLRDPDGNRLCLFRAGENRRFPPWRLEAEAGNRDEET